MPPKKGTPIRATGDAVISCKHPAKRSAIEVDGADKRLELLPTALGEKGVVNEDDFEVLRRFTSLPFPRPAWLEKTEPWRVVLKVIAPRGNEGLRVVEKP